MSPAAEGQPAARRTALVTGAGSGIGAAVTRRLAADGLRVIAADLPSGQQALAEISAESEHVIAEKLDVRDVSAIRQLAASLGERGTAVDVLVNSAGVNRPELALDLTEEDWDLVVSTNLRGTFFCCQTFGRGMIERGWGRIINLSSNLGLVGLPRRAAYGASKGGVINLTRDLAIEWAPHAVTVNSVAPGLIQTPMTDKFLEDPEYRRTVIEGTPNQRIGQPADVAGAVSYLSSDDAVHITGHTLVIDGGYSAR